MSQTTTFTGEPVVQGDGLGKLLASALDAAGVEVENTGRVHKLAPASDPAKRCHLRRETNT